MHTRVPEGSFGGIIPSDRTVAVVHGVHSDGRWALSVAHALFPHFSVRPVRYHGYARRGLGLLRAAFGKGPSEGDLGHHGTPRTRPRRRTLNSVLSQLTSVTHAPALDGVVAHSFGTVLTYWALRCSSQQVATLIFYASPLARKAPWAPMGPGRQITTMHNLVSRSDRMLRLVTRVTVLKRWAPVRRWLARDLGPAGYFGLVPQVSADVHRVALRRGDIGSWTCLRCENGDVAYQHQWNVDLDHSELWERRDMLQRVLRPLLWRVSPGAYHTWLEDLRRVDHAALSGSAAEGDDGTRLFLERRREFLGARTSLADILHYRRPWPVGRYPQVLVRLVRGLAVATRRAIRVDDANWTEGVLNPSIAWWPPDAPTTDDQRHILDPRRASEALLEEWEGA